MMKVLSLTQPWASLVAWGEKKIETRSWYTLYRGELGIHATAKIERYANEAMLHNTHIRQSLLRHGTLVSGLPLGCIVAVCTLVDCVRITHNTIPDEPERSFGDFTPGRYAWYLEEVRMLPEPIPARGALGLWDFDVQL